MNSTINGLSSNPISILLTQKQTKLPLMPRRPETLEGIWTPPLRFNKIINSAPRGRGYTKLYSNFARGHKLRITDEVREREIRFNERLSRVPGFIDEYFLGCWLLTKIKFEIVRGKQKSSTVSLFQLFLMHLSIFTKIIVDSLLKSWSSPMFCITSKLFK